MISSDKILKKIELEYESTYKYFKDFKNNPQYKIYWDKCIEAVSDHELLNNIIFCNEIHKIPPTKTFFMVYKDFFMQFTENNDKGENVGLNATLKKNIGSFWAFVFKFALGYTGQKNIYIGIPDLKVTTATYFFKEGK